MCAQNGSHVSLPVYVRLVDSLCSRAADLRKIDQAKDQNTGTREVVDGVSAYSHIALNTATREVVAGFSAINHLDCIEHSKLLAIFNLQLRIRNTNSVIVNSIILVYIFLAHTLLSGNFLSRA